MTTCSFNVCHHYTYSNDSWNVNLTLIFSSPFSCFNIIVRNICHITSTYTRKLIKAKMYHPNLKQYYKTRHCRRIRTSYPISCISAIERKASKNDKVSVSRDRARCVSCRRQRPRISVTVPARTRLVTRRLQIREIARDESRRAARST